MLMKYLQLFSLHSPSCPPQEPKMVKLDMRDSPSYELKSEGQVPQNSSNFCKMKINSMK